MVTVYSPCRSARPNPCLPLDVCLIVGEPFASFIMEHAPDKAHWISPDEAVGILQAEDQRGHVHHAFFKDAMLGRFYAICNCCSCCCGAIESHKNGTPTLASSGYVAVIDSQNCLACGACETACQFDAISSPDGVSGIDRKKCMGCSVCVGQCVQEAIQMERDQTKGAPLEILSVMDKAAPR